MIQSFIHLHLTQKTWAAQWRTSSSQSTGPVGTSVRPRAGELLPPALWRPPIHQHNHSQSLVKADSSFLGLAATALCRDVFTIRTLIQGNTDKPLRSRLQLRAVVVPQGSDRACVRRGQCDLQRGTWDGRWGDRPPSLVIRTTLFCGSKPSLSKSVALGGGGLCSKMSLLTNHKPVPESPASTHRKREIMFALDA